MASGLSAGRLSRASAARACSARRLRALCGRRYPGCAPRWAEQPVTVFSSSALDCEAKTGFAEDAGQGFELGVASLGEGAVESLPAELRVVGELGDGEALGFCHETKGGDGIFQLGLRRRLRGRRSILERVVVIMQPSTRSFHSFVHVRASPQSCQGHLPPEVS